MLQQRQTAERRRLEAGRALKETVWMDREPWGGKADMGGRVKDWKAGVRWGQGPGEHQGLGAQSQLWVVWHT